jgi:hypothetical protein
VAHRIERIVSGGQTGADRAALDVAIELGIDYGGWCPAGGWAEDFPDRPGLLAAYPNLRATWEPDETVRTRLNVRDSDATLIVYDGLTLSPGTQSTVDAARAERRPLLVTTGDVTKTRTWLDGMGKNITLNVAGPRESTSPGTYARTVDLLRAVLQ